MIKSTRRESQKINNTGLGKSENNKHPGEEGGQHTVRNKLKKDLQIVWHKVRLLQM
jgi:hypothetical protein